MINLKVLTDYKQTLMKTTKWVGGRRERFMPNKARKLAYMKNHVNQYEELKVFPTWENKYLDF